MYFNFKLSVQTLTILKIILTITSQKDLLWLNVSLDLRLMTRGLTWVILVERKSRKAGLYFWILLQLAFIHLRVMQISKKKKSFQQRPLQFIKTFIQNAFILVYIKILLEHWGMIGKKQVYPSPWLLPRLAQIGLILRKAKHQGNILNLAE